MWKFVLLAALVEVVASGQNPPTSARPKIGVVETTLPPMQDVLPVDRPIGNTDSAPPEHGSTKRSNADPVHDLVIAPIPLANQALGIGVVPMVKYVFSLDPNDHKSQPSSINVAGLAATSKSWGAGGGASLNFRHDKYRTAFYAGYGNLNYDLFGIGTSAGAQGQSIEVEQRAGGVFSQALVRLFTGFYVGPRYILGRTKINYDLSQIVPPDVAEALSDVSQTITLSSIGYNVQHDRRNSLFYPTRGHFFQATGDFRADALGSNRTFQEYHFGYNHYFSFSARDVLAVRAAGCGVTGSRVPVFGYCQFGQMGDNRGYQTGRFRDKAMFATQAEYRRIIHKKIGGTVFFGVGEVAPDGRSFSFENLLPSGGLGVRYNLAKQERINLRADFAYSKTGFSWSMGVGEVF